LGEYGDRGIFIACVLIFRLGVVGELAYLLGSRPALPVAGEISCTQAQESARSRAWCQPGANRASGAAQTIAYEGSILMRIKALSITLGAGLIALTSLGASAAGVSGGVVKIGVLTDMSGVYATGTGKGSVAAAQMAIEDFGGTVLGKPIKLVSADHQDKPDLASSIARRWIDSQGVDMITDLVTSSIGIAVQQLASNKHVLTFNTGAGTTALTNKYCTPYGIHYVYDTYALPTGTATAVVKNGGKSWFFITADYEFGHSLQENTTRVVKKLGGTVVGHIDAPLSTNDFSSYLLQAQGSGAQVIALANAGQDFSNAVSQAHEFGITQGGQQIVALLATLPDVKALARKDAAGLMLTTAFYWNRTPGSRAFAKRFYKKVGAMPDMIQAGDYSAVMTYLKAVKAAGTDDADAVRKQLARTTVKDMFTDNGHIRADGLMVHDMYLVQVKKAADSSGPWDLYRIVRTIPGDQAFQPMAQGSCALSQPSASSGKSDSP
jgi:branched-chain amino acid transport system substrate-binding protein